uniref:Uncharacterized protein n=1 Tax=Anopheles coluzzii TaxID=1518534 RepID=A0A8W7P7T1_ANOCL
MVRKEQGDAARRNSSGNSISSASAPATPPRASRCPAAPSPAIISSEMPSLRRSASSSNLRAICWIRSRISSTLSACSSTQLLLPVQHRARLTVRLPPMTLPFREQVERLRVALVLQPRQLPLERTHQRAHLIWYRSICRSRATHSSHSKICSTSFCWRHSSSESQLPSAYSQVRLRLARSTISTSFTPGKRVCCSISATYTISAPGMAPSFSTAVGIQGCVWADDSRYSYSGSAPGT